MGEERNYYNRPAHTIHTYTQSTHTQTHIHAHSCTHINGYTCTTQHTHDKTYFDQMVGKGGKRLGKREEGVERRDSPQKQWAHKGKEVIGHFQDD